MAATGAKKLTSKVWRKSSSVMSTRRTPGSWAALLISRSMGPWVAATLSSDLAQGVGVGDVADHGGRRRGVRASSAAQRVEPLGVAGQADDDRAGRGQVAAELRAQSGRGAGDDGHLAAVAAAEVGGCAGRRSGCGTDGQLRSGVDGSVESVGQSAERAELRRRGGQHGLAGHQHGQLAADADPPGGQRIGRVELAAGHGQRVVVAEHDGRRWPGGRRRVERQGGVAVGHGEHGAHRRRRGVVRGARGHVDDHLGHGEGAVGRGERAGAGRGDGVRQVERARGRR